MYSPNIKKPPLLSVTQLNNYIKSVIEEDSRLLTVFITGEISNYNVNSRSGHAYLTLKDETSVIRGIIYSNTLKTIEQKFQPANGMNVMCVGKVSVYAPSGQYQVIINNIQPDGVGALSLAFEQLKDKLSKQGLFAPEHKLPLPRFPKTIGVITSPTGAALQDIRKTLSRRFPCADVVLCPVLVQGSNAPAQLINAVNTLSDNNACDVIIIGRGGGSVEDLWAFNDENLAYAIYNCKIPVISAVGHQINSTICDFVADVSVATPTAAAEYAVPDKNELIAFYRKQYQYVSSVLKSKLSQSELEVMNFSNKLDLVSPLTKINDFQSQYKSYSSLLPLNMTNLYSNQSGNLKAVASKLETLNPVKILSRGYSIAEKDGKVIASKSNLKKGDEFSLEFSDGKISAMVMGE